MGLRIREVGAEVGMVKMFNLRTGSGSLTVSGYPGDVIFSAEAQMPELDHVSSHGRSNSQTGSLAGLARRRGESLRGETPLRDVKTGFPVLGALSRPISSRLRCQ